MGSNWSDQIAAASPAPPDFLPPGEAAEWMDAAAGIAGDAIADSLDRMAAQLARRATNHQIGTTARSWEEGRAEGYREAADHARRIGRRPE